MTSLNAEDWTIAAITAAVPHPASPAGPGDDAAVLPDDGPLALTTDLLVEGTHFASGHPPEALGWKALAVNLSDVAAMGATATGFSLGLGLPRRWPDATRRRWIARFAAGLGEAAAAAGVGLVGGDTVRADAGVIVAITAWGKLGPRILRRDGARAGDEVWVAGAIGRASEGLRRWLAEDRTAIPDDEAVATMLADPCLRAQLRPEPPLGAGPAAAALGATAGMDLSDGLARDLPRLAEASGVTIELDLDRLPEDRALTDVSPVARAAGGEDYGLVVTAPPTLGDGLARLGFTRLGTVRIRAEDGARVRWTLGGRTIPHPTPDFEHF